MIPDEHESCRPVRKGDPLLTAEEISEMGSHLTQWKITADTTVPRLTREFQFKNFEEALNFANSIAEAAELQNHHPRITLEWGKVRVEWWTHVLGGLHRNDWIMAAVTDRFYRSFTQFKK